MFSFFKGNKNASGLTAVEFRADGVCVVQIARQVSRPPRVTQCEFRKWDKTVPQQKALARLSADYGLKQARCATVLNPDEYSLLLTEAPDVPADELKSAIRWRIKDLIDFHINDATLDVFDVSSQNIPGKARQMYVVAARNEAIQRRVDMCDEAGINLDVIDIPEMAQRNLVSVLPEDNRGIVAISFSPGGGLITITRQGEIFLSRRLDIGLDVLQQGGDLTRYFDTIVLEVQRSLDYYDSHFRQPPVSDLILMPITSEIPGLLDHLNGNLNIKASIMNLNQVVEADPEKSSILLSRCITALGAALRQETKTL